MTIISITLCKPLIDSATCFMHHLIQSTISNTYVCDKECDFYEREKRKIH